MEKGPSCDEPYIMKKKNLLSFVILILYNPNLISTLEWN